MGTAAAVVYRRRPWTKKCPAALERSGPVTDLEYGDMVNDSASEIRQRKLRRLIDNWLDSDKAPRLSPAMHALFDELSNSGFAYEESIRRAMRNSSNLAESTIQNRIGDCIRAGYLIRDRGGIALLELPEALS